jgi:hypothetical protein
MKTTMIFTLAALSTAVGIIGVSANADERNELSRNGDHLSHMFMSSGAVAPAGWLPVPDSSKAEPLQQQTLRSLDGGASVAALSAGTLVNPAASLVGSGQQQMLRSPNGQATGSGFAPIKAALAGQVEIGGQPSRSATAGRLYLFAPPK